MSLNFNDTPLNVNVIRLGYIYIYIYTACVLCLGPQNLRLAAASYRESKMKLIRVFKGTLVSKEYH